MVPKQRIQATKNALKEADNWTTLTNEIEDALDNGDLALISQKLNGIQGSLKILSHVPDFEDRVILVFHLLLLGPLLRFIHILYCGYKEYSNKMENTTEALAVGPYCYHPKLSKMNTLNRTGNQFYLLRKYYQRDSAYLGLIEAFIQDGPQLILQLYILAVRHHDDLSDPYTAVFQAISVFLSLFSLSMTLVSYIQASRWADPSKPQMTPMGYTFNFGW